MQGELVLIFASDYRQACMAAEQLALPIPNAPPPDGWPTENVRYIHHPEQVRALMPDRVIFVAPRIESTIIDYVQHDAAREVVLSRMRKPGANVTIEYVTT